MIVRFISNCVFFHFLLAPLCNSCVADNALGRTKKYIEVSGRPGPAAFQSPAYSNYLDRYNLTYTIESIPPLDEIKLLYRKLMVSRKAMCVLWCSVFRGKRAYLSFSSSDTLTPYSLLFFPKGLGFVYLQISHLNQLL